MTSRLRTAEEVAPELRMHPETLLRKARKRQIGSFRDGSKVLFSDKHVEEYIAANSQDAAPVKVPARRTR